MKKDSNYNLFKKNIVRLHQAGFKLAQGMTEAYYNDIEKETVFNVTIQMYKKGNHEDIVLK